MCYKSFFATGNRKSGEAMRANKAKAKTKKTADNEENAERKRDMWINVETYGDSPFRPDYGIVGAEKEV